MLYIFFLFIFPSILSAQFFHPNFEVENYQLEKDVYDEEYGTKGIRLSFEYKYLNPKLRLQSFVPQVFMYKNGMQVYLDEATILLLETNKWATVSIFIPYRKINLLNGQQDDVALQLKIDNLLDYSTVISFNQPTRYIVEIDLKGGAVKRKLKQYDQSLNPEEWLPDPYYKFTSNEGVKAVYISPLKSNSYDFTQEKMKFYILEGEFLTWSFYDRDGGLDQELGVFKKLNATGDYKDDFYGQMFGNIRNLEFTYSQRAQARQAISIYSDPTYLYKKKKGVAVTIEYDLSRAYVGEQAQIHLNCYNKNGVMLETPTLYAVEGTPEVETFLNLEVKGKLKYFIPFYIWKNACKDIEFYFEIKEGQQINAARHTLLKPIEFDDLVIDAGMEVEQDFVFQGARGVKIGLYYELVNVYEDAPLVVKFTNGDGTKLPFHVYNIMGNDLAVDIIDEQKTTHPKVANRMYYFIPNTSITKNVVQVSVDLIPDLSINIIKENVPLVIRKEGINAADFELVASGGRFWIENYGQVLEMKFRVPKFFLDKSKLNLEVLKNGKPSRAYLIDGYLDENSGNYTLKKDSGTLYLVFPHRNIKEGTTYEISATISSNDLSLSDTIRWSWTAPKGLFNRKVEIALANCRFDSQIMKDTTLNKDFPWKYIVEVGGEVLVQEVLVKKFNGKKIKNQFKQQLLVNREDDINVILVNTKSNEKITLWHGDLGKWRQNKFKVILDNTYPIKKLKVVAKVDDRIEPLLSGSDRGVL